MSAQAMRLKSRIDHYAKQNNLAAQVVLQNYMFERFLERLSRSNYQENFVIKGGMLVAAIVGLDTRSTMDLDTTVRNLALQKEQIADAIQEICAIELFDGVRFQIVSISPIRKDDRYGGLRVRLDAVFDTIITPLSIDLTAGDVITPAAVPYELNGLFEESLRIRLWGYNLETVLAEKVETILSRGVLSTRPRDYYDVYILSTTKTYDVALYRAALAATSVHRNSLAVVRDAEAIFETISQSAALRAAWMKYRKSFSYAKSITYEEVLESLHPLVLQASQI